MDATINLGGWALIALVGTIGYGVGHFQGWVKARNANHARSAR